MRRATPTRSVSEEVSEQVSERIEVGRFSATTISRPSLLLTLRKGASDTSPTRKRGLDLR